LDLTSEESCPPTGISDVRQPGAICPPTGRISCPLSLPRATSRTEFSRQLSAALARLAALETPPTSGGTLPLPTPLPSLLPKPQADSEGTTQPESANNDTESSGLAPRGGESEAPERADPAGNIPAGKAPEAVDSAATHQAHSESDDSPGTESGSTGSDPTDS
jgi:hypothetical protein